MTAVRNDGLSLLFFTITIYFLALGCTVSFTASNGLLESRAKCLPNKYRYEQQQPNQIQRHRRISTYFRQCPKDEYLRSCCCYGPLFASVDDDYEDIVIGADISTGMDTRSLQKKNDNDSDADDSKRSETGSSIISFAKENVFLGIDPTPEILAIMTVYFVEGALSLAGLAQTYILKDELFLGPAEMSAISGLFVLPWTIKPLYGFLSDVFPIFGYRRRSYLILAGIVGSFGYAALGADFWGITTTTNNFFFLTPTTMVVAALLISSASIALSDVVADGLVVQRTRDSTDPKIAGGLQSLCWGSAAVGGLVSSYFSGSLLEVMTPRNVFSITALLPLLVAGISLLINEEPVGNDAPKKNEDTFTSPPPTSAAVIDESSMAQTQAKAAANIMEEVASSSRRQPPQQQQFAVVTNQVKALWKAIKDPKVYKPALFLFLWQSTPSSGGAFFYFITNDLNMGPEFLGRVGLGSSVASLVGIWCYQKYLRTVAIKDILVWSSIASVPLGLTDLLLITHTNRGLGIPDGAFVFGEDAAGSVLGEIAFLPTLVLAAKICPPGVEALLFALLMSMFNASSVLGTELGAILTKALHVTETDFDNLAVLSLICNLSSLYPLLFIGFLDEAGIGQESEADMEEGTT